MKLSTGFQFCCTASILLLPLTLAADDVQSPKPTKPAVSVQPATKDANGFLVHAVESIYQDGPTEIRVLLPDKLDAGKQYPVIYVLPVEAGAGRQFGDGLFEARKLDLANKHGVICVAPTFARLPWYADHPTNAGLRQESHFLKVVVHHIEKTYPAQAKAQGRLLLGFSKSGWGAWSLLLRHPDRFGKAVAWDAPLNMAWPSSYGSKDIFATRENFEAYQISKLLERQGPKLGAEKRLGLLGLDNFRSHHLAIKDTMDRLKVPLEFRDGPRRKHVWESGWVAEAAEFLTGK